MAGKVRVGMVGLGSMGQELLKHLASNPLAEVTVLCDADQRLADSARSAVGPDAEVYTDYTQCLASGGLDAVIVAAPQYLHAEIALSAFDAGLHVFCEKPLALTAGDSRSMISAAESADKVLMVGHVLRYMGVYRWVLESTERGDLGRPLAARIIRTMNGWGGWARSWRARKDLTGGLLLEVNVHEIDFMCQILGEPASVFATGGRYVTGEVDYEDWITAQITFKGGTTGVLTSAMCDYITRYSGEIFFEHGTVYYDNTTSLVRLGKKDGSVEDLPYDAIGKDWENAIYRELREFVESCLGMAPVTIPGKDGLRAVEVGEAAYRSIAEGRPVPLPLNGATPA